MSGVALRVDFARHKGCGPTRCGLSRMPPAAACPADTCPAPERGERERRQSLNGVLLLWPTRGEREREKEQSRAGTGGDSTEDGGREQAEERVTSAVVLLVISKRQRTLPLQNSGHNLPFLTSASSSRSFSRNAPLESRCTWSSSNLYFRNCANISRQTHTACTLPGQAFSAAQAAQTAAAQSSECQNQSSFPQLTNRLNAALRNLRH